MIPLVHLQNRAVQLSLGLAAAGLAVTVGLGLASESAGALSVAGGPATALGRLTGLVGTYLMLITVVLVARLPALESVIGQDRLVAWHRRLAPWPLFLIAAHGVLIAVGYSQAARSGALQELGVLLTTYPGVLAATVGFGLLAMAGVTSYRLARARMRHETWWAVHLYVYLGLALSFSHQLSTGAAFIASPFARAWWISLWAGTAGLALVYRFGVPLWRSLYHRLRVVSIRYEGPGVVSIVCEGHRLDRLAVAGGQFLQWRFLVPGLWWQAHPYSLSALPTSSHLRVTVKVLGDHSGELAGLRSGTRVAIEGPYGAFTRHARARDAVLLVGAGVGVTPVRALLEDLPDHVDVEVVLRGSTAESLVLDREVAELVERRGGRLHRLVGPRSLIQLDQAALRELVPDVAERDVYVCGPASFSASVERAARACGTPPGQVHQEAFAF
ncbi:MAG TPA: ferredoxin reductase family protein [Thermoleophilaceae bacterium]|nr:ferredoxin reductase family protein [Thermoleophilaceae bacterium]